MQDLQFLKEVLSVPTKTYQEERMVQYIVDWLRNEKIEHYVDEHMNVYAIKQEKESQTDFYFPCVVAHTDTVHNIDTINIREEMKLNTSGELKLSLKAYNDEGKHAPENWMVTETCFGAKLFEKESEFFEKCDKVLVEGMNNKQQYMTHPYTDVYALKTKFDFACINFSIGYYDYHTENEYVVVEDTMNGVEMGRKIIESLGYKKYFKTTEKSERFKYW